AAATGAHRADTSSGTSNMAIRTPSNAASDSARTSTSRPRTASRRPALRGEAISRISPHGSRPAAAQSVRMDSITEPTAPVAPTTASTGRSVPAPTALPPIPFRILPIRNMSVLANPGRYGTQPRGGPAERGPRYLSRREARVHGARPAYVLARVLGTYPT